MSNEATKVVMIVDVVSPTPYALLRRAKNFEYRADDRALREFANYDDPVLALTDECQRVLRAISSINQSPSSILGAKMANGASDPSWSRFEDLGFGSSIDESDVEPQQVNQKSSSALRASPRSPTTDLGRPTTPSWADFLSTGFVDDSSNKTSTPMLLPPDKVLPPIDATVRGQSSQSHRRHLDMPTRLEPGEIASITQILIDDSFWWVWISSLAAEEPTSRKAAFGRCALIETILPDGKWMVMEEQVKGAAPEPAVGAYIAEKKGFLGFTKRGRLARRRSGVKKGPLPQDPSKAGLDGTSKTSLAPAQQAKIHQAAVELSKKHQQPPPVSNGVRRGREDVSPSKTNSVFSLQPLIKSEASPAMQWASQYDKSAMRAKYLGDALAGKGSSILQSLPPEGLGIGDLSKTSLSTTGHEQNAPPAPPKEEPVVKEAVPQAEEPRNDPPRHERPAPAAAPPVPLPVMPTAPVEPHLAAEAAEVPLPNGTVKSSAPVEQPQESKEPAIEEVRPSARSPPSPTSKRLKKKHPGPPPSQKTSGIRRLFGTKRSGSRERDSAASPTSPVETNPAILAARRALEGKDGDKENQPNPPQASPGPFSKLRNARSPIAAVQKVNQAAPVQPIATPPRQESPMPEPANPPPPVPDQDRQGAPSTRRDEEYDQLSRVDTNEQEHADREFSTFDQGPLVDQPAFAPQDSPSRSGFFTPEDEPKHRPHHQSVYSAVTMGTLETDDGVSESADMAPGVSSSDRWAQIRKNAAERAARHSEDQGRRSHTETRTDDGETSGEESKSTSSSVRTGPVLTMFSHRISSRSHQGPGCRADRQHGKCATLMATTDSGSAFLFLFIHRPFVTAPLFRIPKTSIHFFCANIFGNDVWEGQELTSAHLPSCHSDFSSPLAQVPSSTGSISWTP